MAVEHTNVRRFVIQPLALELAKVREKGDKHTVLVNNESASAELAPRGSSFQSHATCARYSLNSISEDVVAPATSMQAAPAVGSRELEHLLPTVVYRLSAIIFLMFMPCGASLHM